MIITNLESRELEAYSGLNGYFKQAFDAAKQAMTNTPEVGKYEIDGSNCYYMIQKYTAKAPSESKFESHRDYIDIQIVISGEEIIRFETAEKLNVTKEYTPDCELFGMNGDYDTVRLCAGELAVIYPGEPHAPGISAEGTGSEVVKMVVKIRNI